MFFDFFKKNIYVPEWSRLLEYAQKGCEHRMILAKGGSYQRSEYLRSKLDLIQYIKEKGNMCSQELHDISPFVILGYDLEFRKKRHYKVFRNYGVLYLPSWVMLVGDFEVACRYGVALSKINNRHNDDLKHKLVLLRSIKEKKVIDAEDYKLIIPLAVLGYELRSRKRKTK